MSVNLRLLNPQQRDAVTTTQGPLLVFSGAGTGKTRVITYRIAYLIDQGEDPHSILAVTFTKKAANEMRERVGKLVGKQAARDMVISTFHSFCVRVLREDIEALGYKKNFTICDPNDQLAILRAALKEVVVAGMKFDPGLVQFKMGLAKNAALSPKQLEKRATDDLEFVTARAYDRYQKTLKAQNSVDFDDLLLLTAKLFDRHKKALAKYQRRFKYVMVDEYQDTNHTQYKLVKAIAGGHGNICVVGDDDQSIYGWRGADVGNILSFERDYPGAKVIRLEQNYRSTSIILNAANAVIANNTRRKEKKLWTSQGAGKPIDCIEAPDERDEADEVVRRIAEIGIKKRGTYDDCAVLYRTNAQSRTFEEKLRLRRIPYTVVGGMKYYDRKEIRDVLSYFKCLVNPDDEASLRRIINMPARGISKATVQAISDFSVQHKITMQEALARAEELPVNAKAQDACAAFHDFLERYRKGFAPMKLSVPARKLLEEIAYEDELIRVCDDANEAQGRIENVRELVSALAEYERKPKENSLQHFLDDLATQDEQEDDDAENSHGVKLLSLHSAKGLEFPFVFLVGMEEGLLPHKRSMTDDVDTIDEERRLCYVGITRAQKELTLTHVAERMKFGRPVQPEPSRFLQEIPEGLMNIRSCEEKEAADADSKKSYLSAMRSMLERGDDIDGTPAPRPAPQESRPRRKRRAAPAVGVAPSRQRPSERRGRASRAAPKKTTGSGAKPKLKGLSQTKSKKKK